VLKDGKLPPSRKRTGKLRWWLFALWPSLHNSPDFVNLLLVVHLSEGSSIARGVVVGAVATLLTPRPQPHGVFVPPTPSAPMLFPSPSTESDYPPISLSVHLYPLVLPNIITPVYPSSVGGATTSVCQQLGASGGSLGSHRFVGRLSTAAPVVSSTHCVSSFAVFPCGAVAAASGEHRRPSLQERHRPSGRSVHGTRLLLPSFPGS